MDISVMCILIINAKFWTTCLLLMEETGVPGENHRQTLSHNVVSNTITLTKIKHDKKNYHFHYFSDRLSARES
jgi:hypothetical protein